MKWYELSIRKLKSILPGKTDGEKVTDAYDIKYGHFDYSKDLRSVYHENFSEEFTDLVRSINGKSSKVLICGANNGYEVKFFGGYNVTALDLSITALERLSEEFPHVKVVQGNINKLPFDDGSFDVYVALRTLQSRSVDVEKALSESLRVVRENGHLIYSIPNGYIAEGKVVRGLYDSESGSFDVKKPKQLVEMINRYLEGRKVKAKVVTLKSEILIYGSL